MKEYETGAETWESVEDDNINEDVKKKCMAGRELYRQSGGLRVMSGLNEKLSASAVCS
jgi:hypothetical protein